MFLYKEMGDNRAALLALRDQLAEHADMIWSFVQCMSPDYLQHSDDYPAVTAREAIIALGK